MKKQILKTRTKLIQTISVMIALLALGFTNAQAQVAYSNDFNANSTGWTGNITRTTATSACGSASMRRNLYSGATTGNMISPSVGNSTGGMMTLSFDYKVANWSANTVGTPNTWGSFDVQYGASATGPWTTVYTIDQTNHVVSGTCSTVVVTFTPPAGALYVKWDAFWVAGDYYLNFDNVSITETLAPCSGTPTPGNTISSTGGACVGEPFTLSLQNATTGSGVTYQWESADDAAFTTNVQSLGTAATQTIASQTSASYYRCHVTCSGNTGTSTEVLVTQNAPSGCYCTPTLQTTTYGCTEGDVIAQISVLDGTTNLYTNNSGTGCPSGTAGYSDYTGLGSVVSMTAGNTYGFEVYAGQWAEHYTAWIDYNDDGFFDASERIGYTTSTVSGSGSVGVLGGHATFPVTLSCSPAAGEHRMRVRCAFGQTTGLNILPCAMTTANYGETEDYIVTILPALSCPAPSVLASSNVTATSVDLTWNAGCLETEWIVEYGAMGYTPGTGTSTQVSTTPATTLSMLPCGDLDIYVRAFCAVGDSSTWVGPVSIFTTACPCMGAPAPGATLSSTALPCPGGTTTVSVEFPSTDAGITYQWYDGNGLIVGAESDSYTTPALAGGETYYCEVTCTNSSMTTPTTTYTVSVAPAPTGSSLANPIMVGTAPCTTAPYSDVQTNSAANCFSSTMGQASPEVYYQFDVVENSIVTISHCASGFDTYLHLLDGAGNTITSNDDNGPVCNTSRSSIVETLAPGTYYAVSEGYNTNTGAITTEISAIPVVEASDVSGCPGSMITLVGTPAGGTFSVANPYTGPSTTYTYTYTNMSGCSNTSAVADITTAALNPVTGIVISNITGTTADITWDVVAGAAWYTLRYRVLGSTSWTYVSSNTNVKTLTGLAKNADYELEIRTNCSATSAGVYGSNNTFTTAAGCPDPTNLAVTNLATTTATLTWDPTVGASWYNTRYRQVLSTTWINGSASTNSKNIAGLLAGTDYEFQVLAKCNGGKDVSDWSTIGTFTTGTAAKLANPATNSMEENFENAVTIYPNPVSDMLNIEIIADASQNNVVKLYDMSGRMIKEMHVQSDMGINTVQLSMNEFTTGIYTLQVYANEKLVSTSKVTKK